VGKDLNRLSVYGAGDMVDDDDCKYCCKMMAELAS
jgi:hypothetical protein